MICSFQARRGTRSLLESMILFTSLSTFKCNDRLYLFFRLSDRRNPFQGALCRLCNCKDWFFYKCYFAGPQMDAIHTWKAHCNCIDRLCCTYLSDIFAGLRWTIPEKHTVECRLCNFINRLCCIYHWYFLQALRGTQSMPGSTYSACLSTWIRTRKRSSTPTSPVLQVSLPLHSSLY
jgi:hypothetical protein